MKSKSILNNTISLYLMSFTKLFLPLITLPYLTRVLTTDSYGVVSYVKSCLVYVQLIIDFGFMLSTVKDIIMYRNDQKQLSYICSCTTYARIMMGFIAFLIYCFAACNIEILESEFLFTILSFIPIFLTAFLPDFLFRGLEIMDVMAKRFVISKIISTMLVFAFVKSDQDLLLLPLFDTLGSIAAIVLTFWQLKKIHIHFVLVKFIDCIKTIKVSSTYFVSNIATTIFSALNTLIIGIYFTKSEVAFWSVSFTLISGIQNLYSPISDGIYPVMIRTQNMNYIRRIMIIFMPCIVLGCIFSYIMAPMVIQLVGGADYNSSILIFRCLIPILFFSFPAIIFGWPVLGAIGKVKETTFTTICTTMIQLLLLILLIVSNQMTLVTMAIARDLTECFLMSIRFVYCIRYRHLFKYEHIQ